MTQPPLIEPAHTAVIAMDFQRDIVGENGAFASLFHAEMERAGVITAAGRILRSARALGMKVAYGRAAFQPGYPDLVANVPVLAMAAQYECLVDGSDGAAIVAEVAPQNGDVVVTHPRVSGFHGTALDVTLRGAGIDTIVLMGVATNLTIESTARAAPTWVTALSSSPTHAQPYRRRHTTHRWNRLRCLPTSSLPTTSLESSVAPLHTNNTHGMGEVDVAAIADDVNIAGLWPPR